MGPTERILVAEDSALLRRMLGDVLRGNGWTVLEASDGQTALAVARAEVPSVLLMAREMEGLDGMAVLDALRADPRTADMPIVFVTGHTDARDLAEAWSAAPTTTCASRSTPSSWSRGSAARCACARCSTSWPTATPSSSSSPAPTS